MHSPYLIIRRHPYEEPHHTQLEIIASNGRFSGAIDFYCNVQDIQLIGHELKRFPEKIGSDYYYRYGSKDSAGSAYRYFVLKAYTTNSCGHCALKFEFDLFEQDPNEGKSIFSIPTLPASLSRLGDLMVTFSELKHLELWWDGRNGELRDIHSYTHCR
jgi:hypothetical protein